MNSFELVHMYYIHYKYILVLNIYSKPVIWHQCSYRCRHPIVSHFVLKQSWGCMKVLMYQPSSGRSMISLNTEVQIHAWSSSTLDGSAFIQPRLPCTITRSMVRGLVWPTDLWTCVMWTCIMKARYRCLGCSFQSCEGTCVRVAACAAKSFVVTVIVVVIANWVECLGKRVAKWRVVTNCMQGWVCSRVC